MIKLFIAIRKRLWTKPKWRILRIYTKTIRRKTIEELRGALMLELKDVELEDTEIKFLEGKLYIVNLLLKE